MFYLSTFCAIQGSHASWKVKESRGFFSFKFQDLESLENALWSGKVLEKYSGKLRVTEISCNSSIKCGQLILSKIVKIVATRCNILRLKCSNASNSISAGALPQTPHWVFSLACI